MAGKQISKRTSAKGSTLYGRIGIILAAAALGPLYVAAAPRKAGRDQWQQPARVVADLGLSNGSVIADIGCGRGYFTFRLGKAVGEKGRVFATEISAKSLKAVGSGQEGKADEYRDGDVGADEHEACLGIRGRGPAVQRASSRPEG